MAQSTHAAKSDVGLLLKDHINRQSTSQLAELIKRHQAYLPVADFIGQVIPITNLIQK